MVWRQNRVREMITAMKGQPGKKSTIGYCRYYKHYGALSISMMKKHRCLEKRCPYFEKNLNKGYWEQKREINRLAREERIKNPKYTQGSGWKNNTSTQLQTRDATLNISMKSLLSYFDNESVYHAYIFFKRIPDNIKYIGGFFGFEVSKDKAYEIAVKEAGDIIVIGEIDEAPIGYRIEPKSKQLIEIDLMWGNYNYYREKVEIDLKIRKKLFADNSNNAIDNK